MTENNGAEIKIISARTYWLKYSMILLNPLVDICLLGWHFSYE